MTKKEKLSKCNEYFKELSEKISETYSVVESCNKSEYDITAYLVPNGTENEITYHSKPAFSFRISDHWNWYANVDKCEDEQYVQCYSRELPWPKKRKGPGLASKPISATSVMFTDEHGFYHSIYGEIFDRETKRWFWNETTVDDALKMIGGALCS